jgi:uncharacterized protein YkwD
MITVLIKGVTVKTNKPFNTSVQSALLAAGMVLMATLTGCGGGGGGGEATTTSATETTPATETSTFAASTIGNFSAPTSTYAGEKKVAFDLINAVRGQCGFGSVAQNAALDAAAVAHTNYNVLNPLDANTVTMHGEIAGRPGFTGASIAERYQVQNYGTGVTYWTGGEVISQSPTVTGGVRMLLNAPYHEAIMLSGFKEVGVEVSAPQPSGNSNLTMNFGGRGPSIEGMRQLQSSTDVLTFPCEGSTEVYHTLRNESPNPVPGRDLFANPLGASLYIQLRVGRTLAIQSAVVTRVSTGVVVTLRPTMTQANDPAKHLLGHQAIVTADVPLARNAAYSANITGTNNGVPFTKNFTFTTSNVVL